MFTFSTSCQEVILSVVRQSHLKQYRMYTTVYLRVRMSEEKLKTSSTNFKKHTCIFLQLFDNFDEFTKITGKSKSRK